MNFLELCQRVRQESGISGTGPSTVVGQQGQLAKIIEWVKSSWLEIQTHRTDWDWMWGTLTFDTVLSQDAYTTNTTDIQTFDQVKIYDKVLGISDETVLVKISYDEMRKMSKVGTEQYNRPTHYAIRPDRAIVLSPTPAKIYTLVVDYYKTPQIFSANADVPLLPQAYHDVIVYKALMMFGAHYEAQMQYQHAFSQYASIITLLESFQLPEIKITGPLA